MRTNPWNRKVVDDNYGFLPVISKPLNQKVIEREEIIKVPYKLWLDAKGTNGLNASANKSD